MALDPVILGFLRLEPMTGYQIKKNLDFSVGNFWTISFGGLYPALNRLLHNGAIRLMDDADRTKTYAITPEGENAFMKWLNQPVKKQVIKDGFLLKLFFADEEELLSLLPHVGKRLADVTELHSKLNSQNVKHYTVGQEFCLELAKNQLATEEHLLKNLQAKILKLTEKRS